MDSGIVGLGIAIIGIIAGYSRLESRTGTNSRDIERNELARVEMKKELDSRLALMETKHHELDNRVMDKLSNIEKIVANIQGKLDK